MSEPKRYEAMGPEVIATPTGEFVLWEDYDATCETLAHTETERDASEAENARLKAEVERLNELVNNPYRLSQGWRPIETAPKDGTKVLGYCDAYESVVVMEWFSYSGCRACWETVDGESEVAPTHWMPIPKPPAA